MHQVTSTAQAALNVRMVLVHCSQVQHHCCGFKGGGPLGHTASTALKGMSSSIRAGIEIYIHHHNRQSSLGIRSRAERTALSRCR